MLIRKAEDRKKKAGAASEGEKPIAAEQTEVAPVKSLHERKVESLLTELVEQNVATKDSIDSLTARFECFVLFYFVMPTVLGIIFFLITFLSR